MAIKPTKPTPRLEPLEGRVVPALLTPKLAGTTLLIQSNSGGCDVEVNKVGSNVVVKDNAAGTTLVAPTWRFAATKVGRVSFTGGSGDDTFVNNVHVPTNASGSGGDDYIEGADANDVLLGGDGKDTLKGFGGHDRLYGGDGTDTLEGGNGHDALYGGGSTSADQLFGGSGRDRFLTQPNDVIRDGSGLNSLTGADVEVRFVDSASASWSNTEIRKIDDALQTLFDIKGSNRLLRDSASTEPLSFTQEDIPLDPFGNRTMALNYDPYQKNDIWYSGPWWNRTEHQDRRTVARRIVIDEWNEAAAGQNRDMVDTLLHEVAHNWDSAGEGNSLWNRFTTIAGWRGSKPAGGTHFRSGDGEWWYSKSSASGFFGDVVATGRGNSLRYGKWNPREDFSTTWEFYFANGRPTSDPGGNAVKTAKLKLMDSFFKSL